MSLKNLQKLYLLTITSLLVSTFPPNFAHAETGDSSIITGQVNLNVSFPASQKSTVEHWLLHLLDEHQSQTSFSSYAKADEVIKLKKRFHITGRDAHFITPLPFVSIKIGAKTLQADEHGRFSMKSITPGIYPISVLVNDKTVYQKEMSVIEGTNELTLSVTNSLSDIFANMAHHHNHAAVTPDADTGGGGSSTYHGVPVGDYVGVGLGSMEILTSEGHVSCNKSDWDNGRNFPNNASDCSRAVGAGLIYNTNPYNYSSYFPGTLCVTEGMNSVLREPHQNIYCNGLANNSKNPKPVRTFYLGYMNVGYNCSSFMFLKGDERLNKFVW